MLLVSVWSVVLREGHGGRRRLRAQLRVWGPGACALCCEGACRAASGTGKCLPHS